MPIRVLSPRIASKIAAGEVTERPMSVVKELVENSLDAGATRLSVEIRGGGIEYIRVTDNGTGIAEEEVATAFERFATSKLVNDGDLESVGTFGFRGEALPSIAVVSRVTMVSRAKGEDSGIQVDLDAGTLIRKQRVGAAPGTSVTVRGLFHNIPARRKFLRSAASEATRVQSAVGRFALARPDVGLSLTVEGRSLFVTSGAGSLREATAAVYGAEVAEAMLDIETPGREDGPIQVGGLIGRPSLARSNRNHVTIYVNGRWVQNRSLTFALHEAYRGFLMERRFPIALVSVDVPYAEVDVNVHPSKTEVRIRDEGRVFAALQRACAGDSDRQSARPGAIDAPHDADRWERSIRHTLLLAHSSSEGPGSPGRRDGRYAASSRPRSAVTAAADPAPGAAGPARRRTDQGDIHRGGGAGRDVPHRPARGP